ncbi:hypothetical protein AMR47_11970 [Leptospira interrogans]|nr:hypothetical protein AMR47_11970 [Leptospira interrogans]
MKGKKFEIKFYPYSNLGSSIRVSSEKLEFKIHSSYLSSELENLEAVIDLLLFKLLKYPIPDQLEETIRKFYENYTDQKISSDRNRKRVQLSSSQNKKLRDILEKLNDSYWKIDLSNLEIFGENIDLPQDLDTTIQHII